MSSLPHRVMRDGGPYAAAVHHHASHGAQGAHHAHPPATVTAQCIPCPYESKVVTNGTTARMVLMFLRELVEQLPLYPQFQQTYVCPMMKCYDKFAEPFLLVQHLLSCPELPNGEFDCDKCNNWHEFPTEEKDWTQWAGWSWKSQRHHPPGDNIQRKRSFSSKMRETFTLRKKDPSRKQNSFSSNTRPSTATSDTSSIITNRCHHHEHVHLAFSSAQGNVQNLADLHKPVISVATGPPQIDSKMFWSGLDADLMSGMHSAVSSTAPPSSFDTATSKGTSTNTSQTTLFTPNLGTYNSPTSDVDVITPRYTFSPGPNFDGTSVSMGSYPRPPSDMSLDDPISEAALSPSDLPPTTPGDNRSWWAPKVDMDTPRPTPVASPSYGLEQGLEVHSMYRTLSQESMQPSVTGLYQPTIPEGAKMEPLSPHSAHIHHIHHRADSVSGRSNADTPPEDLVCDECQWKPRGVRENLRGYLRKHKNTHKGLRLPCDVVGCTKTFSRLDNLKKHKKEKHGIEDTAIVLPSKRGVEEYAEHVEENDANHRRPVVMTEADIRGASDDYSMLWPALHF
ncbi:zinc finger C2H2-like protein [Lasiosphaeria hispida]|uniref:Zinc finger C2H2-like protein n=1 Tax=Lasiosphaeria hispida TaxID=260671 RepID=A0AAJ0HUK8_9PEZI|nr:zinc finger C2H2-like protein [Lasiosphaeria hispida]